LRNRGNISYDFNDPFSQSIFLKKDDIEEYCCGEVMQSLGADQGPDAAAV